MAVRQANWLADGDDGRANRNVGATVKRGREIRSAGTVMLVRWCISILNDLRCVWLEGRNEGIESDSVVCGLHRRSIRVALPVYCPPTLNFVSRAEGVVVRRSLPVAQRHLCVLPAIRFAPAAGIDGTESLRFRCREIGN